MGYGRLILFGIILFGLACEDPIDVPIPPGPQRIVVEGWITNELKRHSISISQTVPFGENQNFSSVQDAEVTILSSQGVPLILHHTTGGIYLPDSAWTGKIGENYACRINLADGSRIESSFETLQEVPEIDTLFFTPIEPPTIINGIIQEEYFLTGVLTDFENENNFFRWRLFRNGQLMGLPEHIILFNDRFVDGNQFQVEPRQLIFEPGDTVEIRQYALTEPAFDYYTLLVNQATTLGQSSGTAPAVLRGNLTYINQEGRIVLGYFGASAVTQKKNVVFSEN